MGALRLFVRRPAGSRPQALGSSAFNHNKGKITQEKLRSRLTFANLIATLGLSIAFGSFLQGRFGIVYELLEPAPSQPLVLPGFLRTASGPFVIVLWFGSSSNRTASVRPNDV